VARAEVQLAHLIIETNRNASLAISRVRIVFQKPVMHSPIGIYPGRSAVVAKRGRLITVYAINRIKKESLR